MVGWRVRGWACLSGRSINHKQTKQANGGQLQPPASCVSDDETPPRLRRTRPLDRSIEDDAPTPPRTVRAGHVIHIPADPIYQYYPPNTGDDAKSGRASTPAAASSELACIAERLDYCDCSSKRPRPPPWPPSPLYPLKQWRRRSPPALPWAAPSSYSAAISSSLSSSR